MDRYWKWMWCMIQGLLEGDNSQVTVISSKQWFCLEYPLLISPEHQPKKTRAGCQYGHWSDVLIMDSGRVIRGSSLWRDKRATFHVCPLLKPPPPLTNPLPHVSRCSPPCYICPQSGWRNWDTSCSCDLQFYLGGSRNDSDCWVFLSSPRFWSGLQSVVIITEIIITGRYYKWPDSGCNWM